MKSLHIVTPVKDSIESTLETIKAILSSDIKVPYTYTIYNDFSTAENTALLEKYSKELGFTLVNISDLTDHPSPNYLLVLQRCRREAIAQDAAGNKAAFEQAALKVRKANSDYKAFCNDNGLTPRPDRLQVYTSEDKTGYNRSISSKAVWAARKAGG